MQQVGVSERLLDQIRMNRDPNAGKSAVRAGDGDADAASVRAGLQTRRFCGRALTPLDAQLY